MAAEKKTAVKKKVWVDIVAPKLFYERPIGQSYVADPRSLIGKNLKVNMMNLTGDPKRQSTNVFLRVNSQKENKMGTEFIGLQIVQSSLRRMVRRGKGKIDENVTARTKGGKELLAKLFITTMRLSKSSTMAALRKAAKAAFIQKVAALSFDAMSKEMLSARLQKDIKSKISKIYPVSMVEIRYLKLTGKEGAVVQVKTENKPEVKEEKVGEKEEPVEEEKVEASTEKKEKVKQENIEASNEMKEVKAEASTEEKEIKEKPAEETSDK